MKQKYFLGIHCYFVDFFCILHRHAGGNFEMFDSLCALFCGQLFTDKENDKNQEISELRKADIFLTTKKMHL